MASDAVKKILSAESAFNRSISDTHKTADEIIKEAEKYSGVAVQKRITQASHEVDKVRLDYMEKIDVHSRQSDTDCDKKIAEIRLLAEKNMDNAVNAVIREFF